MQGLVRWGIHMLVYIYLLLPWPSNIYGFLGKPAQTKFKSFLNLFLLPAFYQQRTIPFEGNTLLRGCTSFEGVISPYPHLNFFLNMFLISRH